MGFSYCLTDIFFFFYSQGRVLQDISPIVLNIFLQQGKKIKNQLHIQSVIQINLLHFSLCDF